LALKFGIIKNTAFGLTHVHGFEALREMEKY
jgi:hypothetical protein